MVDFALKLPDHDLTPNEFKELARRIGRAAFVPLFLRFYERVITSEATIEEQRRALADIGRWVGVEEEKKLDPNANLPVFNIVFGAPSIHGATSMQVMEMERPDPPAAAAPLLDPEEMALITQLVRHPDVKERPAQPAPADESQISADAPRQRRNQRHARERSPALRNAVRPAAGVSPDDGAPAQQQAVDPAPEEIASATPATMEDHLADLDRVLGL